MSVTMDDSIRRLTAKRKTALVRDHSGQDHGGGGHAGVACPKKIPRPAGCGGRQMIQSIQQGLLAEDIKVPLTRLCAWFGVPLRTVYYRPTKAAPKVYPRFAEPIKAMIEQEPSFGYKTVAWLLGFNKNTVQRAFQLKGWQLHKRPIGMRPRIEAIPSVATAPNERWSTDMCRVWAGRDGWATLALVIDCHTRELLG